MKLAVVSSDPDRWLPILFPQAVAHESQPEVTNDYDLSDTTGQWVFTEEMTPEKAQALLAELEQQRRGTLTFDDLDDDEGEWQ